VTIYSPDDSSKKTRRHVAAQCCLASSAPEVPGGVSAYKAARNGASREYPWIAIERDQPQQQQISAAGNRQWNGGGVDDGNGEKSQRSQVREPMRH